MILKKANVEKIVTDKVTANVMQDKGWVIVGEVATTEEEDEDEDEKQSLTNKDLKAMLDEKGITYDKRANKNELIALLEGAN